MFKLENKYPSIWNKEKCFNVSLMTTQEQLVEILKYIPGNIVSGQFIPNDLGKKYKQQCQNGY